MKGPPSPLWSATVVGVRSIESVAVAHGDFESGTNGEYCGAGHIFFALQGHFKPLQAVEHIPAMQTSTQTEGCRATAGRILIRYVRTHMAIPLQYSAHRNRCSTYARATWMRKPWEFAPIAFASLFCCLLLSSKWILSHCHYISWFDSKPQTSNFPILL